MDRQQEILYTLTLSLIPQVGNVTFEQLVNLFKSPKNVLDATKGDFKAHKCNTLIINNILNNKDQALATAEKELNFIEKNNIQAILKTDSDYPYRLQQCHGAPNILFGLGNFNSNQKHSIAIVGTRRCTDYGKKMVEKIVGELSESISNLQIISGLASGIDTYAHQAAVNNNVETIGILGNGLNRIYPAANKRLAQQMLENGGLLTEYFSTIADIDATNFAMRNRIIAGMSDCIVVAEAPQRSGALITAK